MDATAAPEDAILENRTFDEIAVGDSASMSTPEEKCLGRPEQNDITGDGSQARRTGRLAAA
jgi:hypothetical protein